MMQSCMRSLSLLLTACNHLHMVLKTNNYWKFEDVFEQTVVTKITLKFSLENL